MSHRQPRLKDQAAALRSAFLAKGLALGCGESLELISRLQGYPSWNVAKAAEGGKLQDAVQALELRIWTATHHHRHGQDQFYFGHCPSEAEVIARIEAVSSWEPSDHEFIEVGGVETFFVDIPMELAKAAERRKPAGLVGVYEVNMPELFTYENPEHLPEWQWVERHARFQHSGNGSEAGVWEFMVFAPQLQDSIENVPASLRAEVDKALELGATWLMFHQG
jgi:hypothetical protein